MKRYRLTQIILLVTGYGLLVTNCYAAGVSSKELIQNAKEYDGREVVFQGEVIGDVMKRGNFCWVNISDNKNALGAFLDSSLADNIIFTGDYNHAGDTVEIGGIFHRSCLEHGGDLDIHVFRITKLKDGYRIEHKVDRKKIRLFLWLMPILCGLIAAAIISRIRKGARQ